MNRSAIAWALPAFLFLGCASPKNDPPPPTPSPAPVALLPAWEREPASVPDGTVVDATKLHRATLDNGLRLIMLQDRRLPYVSLGITVASGASSEELSQAGVAQFTAELMERGAGARDTLALAETMDALGARFGVGSGWDTTTVSVSGLSGDLTVLLEVLRDLVLDPRLPRDEAERVRAEQLAALESDKDSPRTLGARAFARTLYPDHRYGLPSSGTPETVKRLSARDARAFYDKIFVPRDAVFFASGNIDIAALSESARSLFGGWEDREPLAKPAPPPAEAPEATRVVIVDRPDLGQAQILVGHEGIARTDDRRIPAALTNLVLGGSGFSSRLMQKIRAEEGLTYSVSSYFTLRHNPGPFVMSTFTRVPETRRVVDILLAELARLQTDPPAGAELRDAKTLSTGRFALSLETPSAVTSSLVDLTIAELPDDSLDTYRTRVRNVSEADTAAIANTLLHPDRVAIVVVGPAAELEPQLNDLGPVEIQTP
ncbi:MAG: insulinase family protein [Myxococcales bacterium]|nr:insulinase family protein [Myxococcales bacterium]